MESTEGITLGKGEMLGPIKDVERQLNEILKQITNTAIRRKKMKKSLSDYGLV
jgi:hypothetical protein